MGPESVPSALQLGWSFAELRGRNQLLTLGSNRPERARTRPDHSLPLGAQRSAGEREIRDPFGIVTGTVRLAEQLSARRYPRLQLKTWIVPDASHVQAGAPSLARAMAFLG